MAITGSAPSGAAPATTTTGSTTTPAGGEGAAAPTDFLGMLGNLVQASAQTLAQAAAQPAVQPAAQTLAEVAATTAPVLAEVATLTDTEPTTPAVTAPVVAPTAEDTDLSKTPEAAASAAAVLAQMLAVAQTAASSNASVPNAKPSAQPVASTAAVTGEVASPATLAPILAQVQAQAQTPALPALQAPAAAPLSDASVANDDEATAVSPETGAATSPKPATAPAAKSGAFEALLAVADPSTAAKNTDSTDSIGFRSLAALLGERSQAVESRTGVTAPSSDSQTQALQGVMPQATTVATADAVAADTTPDRLRDPVGSAKWADALGARLTMMATRGEQHGSLRLSPEHLGPLEVQIRVQDDKATVWFGAQHADTRAALQDALPRLRELFASSGMQLGDAGVSREAPRQDRTPIELMSRGPLGESVTTEEVILPAAVVSAAHAGVLDTYA